MTTAEEFRAAVLEFARGAFNAKVAEAPLGSHRGPQVDAYVAGCVRGGRLLGLRGVAWCSSFASWCVWSAWSQVNDGADPSQHELHWPGGSTLVLPPVGYRAAVSELVRDARQSGAWREAPSYEPVPGDLCIMGRGGQDPRAGGDGHVAIVDAPGDDGGWWCIGGNQAHAVSREIRRLSDVAEPIVGWVAIGSGLANDDGGT